MMNLIVVTVVTVETPSNTEDINNDNYNCYNGIISASNGFNDYCCENRCLTDMGKYYITTVTTVSTVNLPLTNSRPKVILYTGSRSGIPSHYVEISKIEGFECNAWHTPGQNCKNFRASLKGPCVRAIYRSIFSRTFSVISLKTTNFFGTESVLFGGRLENRS